MADSLSSQLEPLAAQAGGVGQPGLVNGVPQVLVVKFASL